MKMQSVIKDTSFAALLMLTCCASHTVWAELLVIENAGFEAPYQGGEVQTGSFPVGNPPTGWERYDENGQSVPGSFLGVLNPGTQADYDADGAGLPPCFPEGAPEGDNVALLFKSGPGAADDYGIQQQLNTALQDNTHYTLTVEVGNIQTCAGLPPGFRNTFVLDGFPGYRIELRAGNDVLVADDNSLLPAEGTFETSTIMFTSGLDHPASGQAITIRLISLNNAVASGNLEVDFDNIRLEAVPVTQVSIGYLPLFILMLLITFIPFLQFPKQKF